MARRLLLVADIVKDLSKKKLSQLSTALEAAQAAYDCAGRPRGIFTEVDVEAELSEVARGLGRSR